ncbi:MAG TPA: hypothetical protein VIE16_07455 [Phenylobacterium sp.]|jgi:hypothetical protein
MKREAASRNTLHRSKNERKEQDMVHSMMKAFDRAALAIFMVLAVTPMLAVAVAASIH